MTINKKRYNQGLLAFYELNRIDILKQEYIDSYLKSIERYMSRANVVKKTDRAVLIFRNPINEGIKIYVKNHKQKGIEQIVDNMLVSLKFTKKDRLYLDNNKINSRQYLIQEITDAAKTLNQNNIVAYGITLEEFKQF